MEAKVNPLKDAAQSLVAALSQAGNSEAAEAWRKTFADRGWDSVSSADMTTILEQLHGTIAPRSDAPVPTTPLAKRTSISGIEFTLPDWAQPLSLFKPFIETLDHRGPDASLRVLQKVASILQANTFESLTTSVRGLFVDELAFEADEVNETSRLNTQASLTQVARVAAHDGLIVLVVQNIYSGPYASTYIPIFRLHPHALVFSISPDLLRTRLVYKRGPNDTDVTYRTLVGPQWRRSPKENLLVTARRVAAFRPKQRETGEQLERRIVEEIEASPTSLAAAWASSGFSHDRIPGPGWTAACLAQTLSFLQYDIAPECRLPWGLHGILRHRFPLTIARGGARLSLLAWRVSDAETLNTDRWHLIARRQTRAVEVTLSMKCAIQASDAADLYFELQCQLPVPDSLGELVLEGTPYRIRIDARSDMDVLGDELDPLAAQLAEAEPDVPETAVSSETAGAGLADTFDDGEDLEDTSMPDDWRSEPFSPLLGELWGRLIEQRLRSLAVALYRRTFIPATASDAARLFGVQDQTFSLVTLSALQRHLDVQSDLRPTAAPSVLSSHAVPPAWACAESSRYETPGVWQPIAGARLHPGGALAVPRPRDGSWKLETTNESAFIVQDRWTPQPIASPQEWWVSEQLQGLAGSGRGAIRRVHVEGWTPLATVRGIVRRASTKDVRILLSSTAVRTMRPPRLRSYRVVDIPNPEGDATMSPPILMVAAGDRVRAGQPWLDVPASAWNHGGSAEPHALQVIRDRFEGKKAASRRYLLFLGPDEWGRVIDVQLHAVQGPLGGTAAWRASLMLDRGHSGLVVSLPNGQVRVPEIVAPEEMPYDHSGDVCNVAVEDPDFTAPESNAQSGMDLYFEGSEGELIEDCSPIRATIASRWNARSPCFPDRHLRFRWIDGTGIPSDASAPYLTSERRAWLVDAYPGIGDACSKVERAFAAGHPSHLPGIQRLALASACHPIRLGPLEWQSSYFSRPRRHHDFDPMVRFPKGTTSQQGMVEWTCSCGALRGMPQAMVTCRSCEGPVLMRPVEQRTAFVPEIQLPVSVLHPWRKAAAGALVGLTVSEMDGLIGKYGHRPMLELARSASNDPLSRASARMNSDRRCPALGRGLHDLRDLVAMCQAEDSALLELLWLSAIPVLPELRRITGAPPGTPALLSATVLLRYRRIELAVEHARTLAELASPQLEQATWEAIQHAVDLLFGTPDESAAPGTLCGLLRRVWPTTRARKLPVTVPGLFRQPRPATRMRMPNRLFTKKRALPVQVVDTDTECFELADLLATPEAILTLPQDDRPVRAHLAESWKERWAFHQLKTRRHQLAAIADATTLLKIPAEVWRDWSWPEAVPRKLLGRVALSSCWRLLLRSEASPFSFLRLLSGMQLPRDLDQAIATLEKTLRRVFATSDIGSAIVVYCFARVMTGWIVTPVSAVAPLGGRWLPESSPEAPDEQRAIPAASSNLWQLLPAYIPLSRPEAFLDSAASRKELSEVVKAQLGFDVLQVPEPWWTPITALPSSADAHTSNLVDLQQPSTLDAQPAKVALIRTETSQPATADARVFEGEALTWVKEALSTFGTAI